MTSFGRVAGAGALVLTLMATAGCTTLERVYQGPVVVAPDMCAGLNTSIYFERDSAALTREAKALLSGTAAQAESCKFTRVLVNGLSDPVGAPAANVALSERRAEAVTRELARLGFSQVTFQLIAAGETGSMTPSGEIQPLRRRADIIFSAPQ